MATTAKTRPGSDKPAFDASKPKAYEPLELLPDPPKSKRYYTVLSVDDHMVEPARGP